MGVGGHGSCVGSRSVGPHDLALEVVDDQREVEVEYMAALGHQQLQGEEVTFMLQELLRHVLGGRWELTRMDRGQTVSTAFLRSASAQVPACRATT